MQSANPFASSTSLNQSYTLTLASTPQQHQLSAMTTGARVSVAEPHEMGAVNITSLNNNHPHPCTTSTGSENTTNPSEMGVLSVNGFPAFVIGLCIAKVVKKWLPNAILGAVVGAGMMYKAVDLGYAEVRWSEMLHDAVLACRGFIQSSSPETSSSLRSRVSKLSAAFWTGVLGGVVL